MQPYISFATIPKQFAWSEEIISESKSGPITALIVEGEFQRAETPNRNNRVYSKQLLDRETKRLQKFIEERNGLPLGMDHPLPDDSETGMAIIQRLGMENTCAIATQLDMHDNVVYGKARVLEGDHGTGDKLAALIRAGFKPGISSRGMGGKPAYTPEGYVMVPEDYTMICYDFVSQPSTMNAILQKQINEEVQLMESIKHDSQKKVWDVLINLSDKYK